MENIDGFVNLRHSTENMRIAFAVGNKLHVQVIIFSDVVHNYRSIKILITL